MSVFIITASAENPEGSSLQRYGESDRVAPEPRPSSLFGSSEWLENRTGPRWRELQPGLRQYFLAPGQRGSVGRQTRVERERLVPSSGPAAPPA